LNVLTISDLHFPWPHPAAFDFLADLRRRHKPQRVVCLGDEWDAYAFSLYRKSPEADGPAREVAKARRCVRRLASLFPKLDICESNHVLRPFKRASEAGLPGSFLKAVREVLDAPSGWSWAPSWTIDGVLYFHGDGFSGPQSAAKASDSYRMNVVMGHVHSAGGVAWRSGHKGPLWGLNAGCLIDPKGLCFDYATNTSKRPVLGTGLVLDGVPHFEPLRS
jgi:hypothetical protein